MVEALARALGRRSLEERLTEPTGLPLPPPSLGLDRSPGEGEGRIPSAVALEEGRGVEGDEGARAGLPWEEEEERAEEEGPPPWEDLAGVGAFARFPPPWEPDPADLRGTGGGEPGGLEES